MKRTWFCLVSLVAICISHKIPAQERPAAPLAIADLICFWDFQEGEGRLTSKGPYHYTLEDGMAKLHRRPKGFFGRSALKIERGQWLRILRRDCPALNLHGDDPVTIVAWIQRGCDAPWQYIAGVWNERDRMRQYALFTCGHRQTNCKTLERIPARHQVHGYVSEVGGATPGKPDSPAR